MTAFGVQTMQLDLPALAGEFGRRLREAGVPVTAERSARFAQALTLIRPVSRRRLYYTARAVFVSDPTQMGAFDRVFGEVFRGVGGDRGPEPDLSSAVAPAPPDDVRPGIDRRDGSTNEARAVNSAMHKQLRADAVEAPVPMLASGEEILRSTRFDALTPEELAELYRLMARLRIATPLRRTRRRRRVVRRRVVMLCDISGSMEPYARAYLQFLTCAAGSGPNAEAFAFATRLTRLTRALASRNPERAIQRAAAAAPDWSSGTRIGDALKGFNDRHGRRGMARGAVIVILSDGWERGDPALVGREMARLRRLAYRIVWVNPRAAASGFSPRAGGMAAALPHCDALVSGHSLAALEEVVDAVGAKRGGGRVEPLARGSDQGAVDAEPWGSATPVPGSSVAMPSGYGPSRGKTTPGWSIG